MGQEFPIIRFVEASEHYACESVQNKNLQDELRPIVYRLLSVDHGTITGSTDKEYILDLMFALEQARSARQPPLHIVKGEHRVVLGEDRPISGKLP